MKSLGRTLKEFSRDVLNKGRNRTSRREGVLGVDQRHLSIYPSLPNPSTQVFKWGQNEATICTYPLIPYYLLLLSVSPNSQKPCLLCFYDLLEDMGQHRKSLCNTQSASQKLRLQDPCAGITPFCLPGSIIPTEGCTPTAKKHSAKVG